MKTLYLLRHAKSSWDDQELKDFERPLSSRGATDAPTIAQRFVERGNQVDCIISSPAVRAKTTAMLLAEAINYPVSNIVSNSELYFAGTGMFLKAASQADEACDSVLFVGHNPAITEFANVMTGAALDNIPTCGLVELILPIDKWADIKLGDARLVHFDYPKKEIGN